MTQGVEMEDGLYTPLHDNEPQYPNCKEKMWNPNATLLLVA